MQVFEFHFNPQLPERSEGQEMNRVQRLRPGLVFDSFCYEPENIYEKRMGNLYLTGILKNVLPQNLHFLDKLAKVIQREYYRSTIIKPEKALRESLKEANEFLEQIAKKGDVSWLGNLSFAVLSLKNYQLNFTKIGDLKIFLLRGKRIIDIDQKLKFEDLQPWPLKIFGNIVSGKLAEGDVLLISTKEVTDFFEKENLLTEIGKIWPLDEKGLREIFDKGKEEILKISGICLIITLTKEALVGKKQVISPKLYPKEFNLKEIFTPYLRSLGKRFSPFINMFGRRDKSLLPPRSTIVEFGKGLIRKPKLGKFPKLPKFPKPNKKLILILALIFFLALGFFISQLQEKKELREREITLKEIQEKVNRAESFLILKTPRAEKEANLLFKESWEEISQLAKIVSKGPKGFRGQVFSLRNEVSKALFGLNKLETIEEPELFFDFGRQGFVPQKMVFSNKNIYFFSPYSQNLFELVDETPFHLRPHPASRDSVNENGEGKLIEKDKKFNLAASVAETSSHLPPRPAERGSVLDDSVLFFSKPNQIVILKDEKFFEFSLKEPYSDFSPDDFASFRRHLYFLDKNSAEIIKYPYIKDFEWGSPQLRLAREEKKVLQARSFAVDGSIWLLAPRQKNGGGSLNRYYAGQFQEKIILEIFPEPKEFKKIFTSATLPYLYLLEPIQKRMVILDKKGQIIKQFQSQKFDNLLDFAVSEDGKTIWLLNGLKVYKILF